MNAHEKNMTKTLLVETTKLIGWVFVDPCSSIHRPPHSNSHRRCKKRWRFLLPQICHNYGRIHWGWFLRIFCLFCLFMGWFMVISLMRFNLWYHFGFCGKLRGGVLTERKINTFDGQSMTNFCMFKARSKHIQTNKILNGDQNHCLIFCPSTDMPWTKWCFNPAGSAG